MAKRRAAISGATTGPCERNLIPAKAAMHLSRASRAAGSSAPPIAGSGTPPGHGIGASRRRPFTGIKTVKPGCARGAVNRSTEAPELSIRGPLTTAPRSAFTKPDGRAPGASSAPARSAARALRCIARTPARHAGRGAEERRSLARIRANAATFGAGERPRPTLESGESGARRLWSGMATAVCIAGPTSGLTCIIGSRIATQNPMRWRIF